MAEVQREHEFMRTADAVNKFIISTTQFLNRFAARCDSQLLEICRSLQRLEILTVLLENKIKSIDDDFNEVNAASPSPSTAAFPQSASVGVGGSTPLAIADREVPPPMPGLVSASGGHHHPPPPPHLQRRNGPPPPPGAAIQNRINGNAAVPVQSSLPVPPMPPSFVVGQLPAGSLPPPPPPMPLLGGFTMCTHPRLQGYFQMLALRVPVEAVKAKMQVDGHQPEWLDTPYAAAPTTIPVTNNTLYDSD
ncbi:hypothetical protein MOQ_004753 [Trypanosoma cruzi marinkellei]|uniref:Uncharacterized protein n=1 Tax=Trypanosoma cruzi marinkellei TaxID=85056 RepID=K2M8N6_TRYCR|nr:hypothetical protein MOQ_004753 [Trypanosoma cruzi marinkellei]